MTDTVATRRQLALAVGTVAISATSIGAQFASTEYAVPFRNYFSPIVWGTLALGLVAILAVSVDVAITGDSRYLKRTILAIGVLYGLFHFLPQFAGLPWYAPPRADPLTHFGAVKEIVATGEFPELMYPGLHLFVGAAALTSTLPVHVFQPLLALVGQVLLALGVALLTYRLAGRRAALLALTAALPLVYGKYQHMFQPWFLSFCLIPIGFLLLEINRKQIRTDTDPIWVLFILGPAMVLMHPMTAIVFLAAVIVHWVGYELSNRTQQSRWQPRIHLAWILIPVIVHAHWYLAQPGFTRKLNVVILGFVQGSAGAEAQVTQAGAVSLTTLDLLTRYLIPQAGSVAIYLIAGALLSAWAISIFSRREAPSEIIIPMLWAGVGAALFVIGFAFSLIATGVVRLNQLTVLASMLLIAVVADRWLRSDVASRRRAVGVLFAGMVLTSGLVGAASVYDGRGSITDGEFEGTEWMLENRDVQERVLSMKTAHVAERYSRWQESYRPFNQWMYARERPVTHLHRRLGYERRWTVAAAHNVTDAYAITTERARQWRSTEPRYRWESVEHYTSGDLSRLNVDATAGSIYSNGDFSAWTVGHSRNRS